MKETGNKRGIGKRKEKKRKEKLIIIPINDAYITVAGEVLDVPFVYQDIAKFNLLNFCKSGFSLGTCLNHRLIKCPPRLKVIIKGRIAETCHDPTKQLGTTFMQTETLVQNTCSSF